MGDTGDVEYRTGSSTVGDSHITEGLLGLSLLGLKVKMTMEDARAVSLKKLQWGLETWLSG